MHTPEYIERSLQACFMSLHQQGDVKKNLLACLTLFATLVESDVPACMRKQYYGLKQSILTVATCLERGNEGENYKADSDKNAQEILRQLLAFYKEICGWLAVESYIASRNQILYHHALCE